MILGQRTVATTVIFLVGKNQVPKKPTSELGLMQRRQEVQEILSVTPLIPEGLCHFGVHRVTSHHISRYESGANFLSGAN